MMPPVMSRWATTLASPSPIAPPRDAIGFSDLFTLALVLAESVLIASLGGAIGLGLASVVAQRDITGGIIPTYLSGRSLAGGALVALATGAIAGVLPALGAMRLQVAAALRRV